MTTQTCLNANLMEAIAAGVSKEHALNAIATVSCDFILIFCSTCFTLFSFSVTSYSTSTLPPTTASTVTDNHECYECPEWGVLYMYVLR